ncbi:AAA ATPase domain-containing protein [Salinibacillus kushneri]|uniref:AAA ATPase domain-containing protein n=1 Tax=Salinibacillus kushneri TaxID=237682 RepID=A0A1H9YNS2_9BACI|nr:ATP-binding protein [Salinibacillus kushneri]SES70776.1 AAA ATPase domain-containing protein [Salinibacillus kushneri]
MAFKNSNQQNRTPFYNNKDLDLFIGRDEELRQLEEIITYPEKFPYRMVYIHGVAGIGKTLLVRMLCHRLPNHNQSFLTLDCRGLKAIPDLFSKSLIDILKEMNSPQNFSGFGQSQNHSFILFIDHYDEENLIAEWIQEHIIAEVPEHILIILSGRHSLHGEWLSSPVWQQGIKTLELKKLTFEEVKLYLQLRGCHQSSALYKLWHFTKGHPLALSLFTAKLQKTQNDKLKLTEAFDVMEYLVQTFLKEMDRNPEFRSLLEISTILHDFNEESLSYIKNQEVSSVQFDYLVKLSFIKQGKNGWFLDPFVRQIMNHYFKHRHPQRYDEISKRAAAYYRQKIFSSSKQTKLELYISEFVYHLGDALIASSLFDMAEGTEYRLETGNKQNFLDVVKYFENRKEHAPKYEVDYYNPKTDDQYSFRVSSEHNQKENELIDVQTLKQLGYDIFKMLKDEKGNTVGMSIVIPINRNFFTEVPGFSKLFSSTVNKGAKRMEGCG